MRKGYVRHLKNKTIRVSSGCIKAQSDSGLKRTNIDKEMMTKKKRIHDFIRKSVGTLKCRSGQIIREGYLRNAYKRKTGVYVDATIVPPACIQDTGKPGKGPQLFVLHKGDLTKYGYHSNLSETKRHEALTLALKHIKPLSVYRKLNALYILNKNKDPIISKIYKNDANWVRSFF
jgi:hypothetical protein